jgi:hypothetical protein
MNIKPNSSQESPLARQRSVWFGIVGGVFTLIAAISLLTAGMYIVGNISALFTDTKELWTDQTNEAGSVGWFATQAINFLSSVIAGFIGCWLSPPRSRLTPFVLFGIAVLVVFFAQFPVTRSLWIMLFWMSCGPIGVITGSVLHWCYEPRALKSNAAN